MSHEELLARHRKVMPAWLTLYYDQPIELVDGKGCRVVDGEGNTYLDFFGGNPVAARAALAVLDYLQVHDLQRNARTVGARLAAGLRGLAAGNPAIGDVRGKGLMLAVELVEPGTGAPDARAAARAQEAARRGGLLVGKGGLYGNVLRIAPPLVVTEAEADQGIEVLAAALATAG